MMIMQASIIAVALTLPTCTAAVGAVRAGCCCNCQLAAIGRNDVTGDFALREAPIIRYLIHAYMHTYLMYVAHASQLVSSPDSQRQYHHELTLFCSPHVAEVVLADSSNMR